MTTHLSEDERQTLADGSLPAERRAALDAHLATCAACEDDVARLRRLMTDVRTAPPPAPSAALDDLWPGIRARIERGKVVPFPAPDAPRVEVGPAAPHVAPHVAPGIGPRDVRRARWGAAALGTAVAAAALLVTTLGDRRPAAAPAAVVVQPESASMIVPVVDSAGDYQQQVAALLADLELRRAMMRPETAADVARDLRLIDDAIAELREAMTRDPGNAALRQLLAASLRQKRDLLRRASDAT